MEKQLLKDMMRATAINFQFKLTKDFEPIFEMVYKAVKNIDAAFIERKFQELWKMTSDEWNNKFGFRGYPSLSSWLEILQEKPKTEEEIRIEKRKYEENLRFKASVVSLWVSDPNLTILLSSKLKNEDNQHFKDMIYSYCGISGDLSKEEIVKLSAKLKKDLLADPQAFRKAFIELGRKQQPFLLT
jgi:hypothetical protein